MQDEPILMKLCVEETQIESHFTHFQNQPKDIHTCNLLVRQRWHGNQNKFHREPLMKPVKMLVSSGDLYICGLDRTNEMQLERGSEPKKI